MIITSKQNSTVKMLTGLRRRRDREQAGVTLVDGFEELRCALDAGVHLKTLFYCPELMGQGQSSELDRLVQSGLEAVELSREVFQKVSYREGPDGWLAIVPAPAANLASIKVSDSPFILVCESIEKPGNLGAMLRTADAAGVDAVISVSGVTDWGNPNVIRASKGTVFSVPVVETTKGEFFAWLKKHKIKSIVSTPDTTIPYTTPDLTQGVALTVGSEKYGHSQAWLDAADVKVCIPMAGKVNSLNVATSAALLLYEAVRQRAVKT